MNPRLAAGIVAGLLAYAILAWTVYVAEYRRSRDETIARLLLSGARRMRPRLIEEEGIENAERR